MDRTVEQPALSHYDRIFKTFQKRLADQINVPFEIRLWGDRTYRFGKGEPAVKVVVKDHDGLAALSGLDELKICEAYMAGSLDVVGDMLGFVSLRGMLSDKHPMHALWRRISPLFVGRVKTDRQAIASHYDFDNDYNLTSRYEKSVEQPILIGRDVMIEDETETHNLVDPVNQSAIEDQIQAL